MKISPTLLLAGSLVAQVLPPTDGTPEVDTITPVPLPSIPTANVMESMTMPKDLKLDNHGGTIEGNVETGVRFGGPIKVTGDNGLEIFANHAELDLKGKLVRLTGDVAVYQGNLLQRGQEAVYYYERKFLDNKGMKASVDPVILEAGKFTAEKRGDKMVFVGENAGVTTQDEEVPDYWVRAGKTTVYPGERLEFKDLSVYVKDRKIFWLPYLSQPLDRDLGYQILPGMRSNWGAFLMNTYGVMLGQGNEALGGENPWLLSKWHADLRMRRGVGFGVDLQDIRKRELEDFTGFSFYYLNDFDPSLSRTGTPRGFVNEDRFKYQFKYRYEPLIADGGDWRIDTNLTLLSDNYYLEDYERDLYRVDPAPDNTVGIYRRDDRSLLSGVVRMQLNDFYRSDTRTPELGYDQVRAPFFGTSILHEGKTTLGWIGENASDFTKTQILRPLSGMVTGDAGANSLLSQLGGYERRMAEAMLALPIGDPRREQIQNQLENSSYVRLNTYQEWSRPFEIVDGMTIVPRAGLGYTRYGAVDEGESFGRLSYQVGAEASAKFSKDYGDIENRQWGLNGLKHVVQPYVNWSILSTDDYEYGDPNTDRLTPTTRPQPLNPINFLAVDEMRSWDVVRVGTRNRLVTQRDHRNFEWLFLDSYMDFFIEDPEGLRTFSNFYNDARWQPLPWLALEVQSQVPLQGAETNFSEFASRLRFMPNESFEFTVGQRYLDNHPVLTNSNRFDVETYTRLNGSWGVSTRHLLEMDDGTMELQQYMLNRNLGNWVLGFGVSARDNRIDKEYGAMLTLTLKDFPKNSLPLKFSSE